jgi:hypothetical protein
MLGWMRRRGTGAIARPIAAAAHSAHEARASIGEYQSLYKYLRDRYADRVVLTFGEIEDLLGFSLPAPARLEREWWGVTEPVARRSAQSDSWTLASRTATVNLSAQSVVFERHAESYRGQ